MASPFAQLSMQSDTDNETPSNTRSRRGGNSAISFALGAGLGVLCYCGYNYVSSLSDSKALGRGSAAEDYDLEYDLQYDVQGQNPQYDYVSDMVSAAGPPLEVGEEGYTCQSNLDFGEVVAADRKGIALDDTTFEYCADQVPAKWPNTNQPLLSVRLFKAWGMTDPKFFHTDMMKAWKGLRNFARASGGKFLLGVSVTCNAKNDEKEWAAGREFIKYVGAEHIMGLAVGNEIDLQVGAANGGCINNLWYRGGYLKTLIKRVEEFDAIPGMSGLPVTAVMSFQAYMHSGSFTSKVDNFLKGAWAHFGDRFVMSINTYPQFSGRLAGAGCHGAATIGAKYNSADGHAGFIPGTVKDLRRRMAKLGGENKKLWIGEVGWATSAYCVLGCAEACRSKQTSQRHYQNFLKWDLQAGPEAKVDHVFYFTVRDSSVFGKREEFGLIPRCGATKCKFQK